MRAAQFLFRITNQFRDARIDFLLRARPPVGLIAPAAPARAGRPRTFEMRPAAPFMRL
jgi:hypothetical protein